MTAFWVPPGKQTFVDADGKPLVGGFVYHYVPATSTLKDTWQDPDQMSLNTNPIVLDARGQADIWGIGMYRQVLQDADGNEIWNRDTGFDITGLLADYALKDLSNVTGVNFAAKDFLADGASTASNLFLRFGNHLNVMDDFGAGASVPDNSAALTAAFSYARLNDRAMGLPTARYLYSTTISISNTGTETDGAMIIQGEGWTQYSGNVAGSSLVYGGASGSAVAMIGTNVNNQDGSVEFRNFNIMGPAQGEIAGADGFRGEYVNNTLFHNMSMSYNGRAGLRQGHGFSSRVDGGLFIQNYYRGIDYINSANRVRLKDVVAYLNGRALNDTDQCNIGFSGTPSYAPLIDNCDFSYAGKALFTWTGSGSAKQMTSIDVAGLVATVNCAEPHGLSNGDKITFKFSTTPGLGGHRFFRVVTVIDPVTFECPTAAANGTYDSGTDPNLIIGNYSTGLALSNVTGAALITPYCETPYGTGVYVGVTCSGLSFVGGFMLDAWMEVDVGAKHIEIGGMRFDGGEGGLVTAEVNDRPTINVKSSNVFTGSTQWIHGAYYMKDGQRYGPAPGVSSEWQVGEVLWNSAPAVGQPAFWMVIAAGGPPTWGIGPLLT